MSNLTEFYGEPIHVYTRAQAVRDGALHDVSTVGAEAGFLWPVALTAGARSEVVAWDDAADQRKGFTGQSEEGRLWDVLSMARLAVHRTRNALATGVHIPFQVACVPREGRGVRPRLTALVVTVGPGDDGAPVLTIMLPGED